MTRKDTILIAVIINAGLLAILFTTAIIYDTDKKTENSDTSFPLANNVPLPSEPPSSLIASAQTSMDELDNVLKYYGEPSSQPIVLETEQQAQMPEPIAIQINGEENELEHQPNLSPQQIVEVKVKKGDVLEKIARSHKTSVAEIKKLNHLESENLSIGQILKVPSKNEVSSTTSRSDKGETKKTKEADETGVYYVVKSNDNPWKIAKQFDVKYEEILRLNHLDEEKARNLKIGDRIRVK